MFEIKRPKFSWVYLALFGLVFATAGVYIVYNSFANNGLGRNLGKTITNPVTGQEAIDSLGPNLPSVAQEHGKSVQALERAFREDKTLFVDSNHRLFYREDAVPESAGEVISESLLSATDILPSDAFSLHTQVGAKRIIYLDFDGHTISGASWNAYNGGADIIAPAWDIEGGTSVFTDNERAIIIKVWSRVAEDYAAFDVDVTTEFPGEDRMSRSSTADELYGMRVLISPISSYFAGQGGVAYVGVFNHTAEYYKPALVFPENLINGEKSIAEASSHEVGHTLGLMHDGTTAGVAYYSGHGAGETGWAPIMGNSYYRNVTQWSRGEYDLANNTEDDLATILTYGLAYRNDDHGNTDSDATWLPSGASLSASGVIERSGDIDVLAFSASAGQATISVNPTNLGPNLDLGLRLKDITGSDLATSEPTETLKATVSATIPEGTYFLEVRGTGNLDSLSTGYSNYASLGQWSLSGTIVAPVSDSLPPTVNLLTPTDGETVSNSVNISATANDNLGVSKVEFYVDGLLLNTDSVTPYSYAWDASAATNGSHIIYAKAFDLANNIGVSASVEVVVLNSDVTPPTPPGNLVGTANSYNKVTLGWSPAKDNVGVIGYYVLRSIGTTDLVTIAQVDTSVTSYVDNGVQPQTSYSYQLKAYDLAGNISSPVTTSVTTPSIPDTTPPTAPTNLVGTAVSSNQINLGWSPSSDNIGVGGYDVYRNGAKIATVSSTSYGNTGLSAQTTYQYYVVSRDVAGNISQSSNVVSVTTQAAQATTGNIQGIVSDISGNPVSGVKVSVTANRKKFYTYTNSLGYYSFGSLPVGGHKFSFSKKGFVTQSAVLAISSGQTILKNISLVKR